MTKKEELRHRQYAMGRDQARVHSMLCERGVLGSLKGCKIYLFFLCLFLFLLNNSCFNKVGFVTPFLLRSRKKH